MAKHWLEGREVPPFFYGQSYGFVWPEMLVLGAAFKVFGMTTLTVRMSMLCFWVVGVLSYYSFLKKLFRDSPNLALWGGVLLAVAPPWCWWGMLARGGYTTSFVASCVAAGFLVERKPQRLSWALSFLLGIVALSQPLWLPGLLILLGLRVCFRECHWFQLCTGLGFVCTGLGAQIVGWTSRPSVWMPNRLIPFQAIPFALIDLPGRVTRHFMPFESIETNGLSRSFASWCGAMTFLVTILSLAHQRLRPGHWRELGVSLSVLATLFFCVAINADSPRYLLPLTGWLIAAGLGLPRIHSVLGRIVLGGTVMCALAVCWTASGIRQDRGSEKHLLEAIQALESHRIQYCYCYDPLLQWQVCWYSRERVLARWAMNRERFPEYVRRIDQALEKGEPVGRIGFHGRMPEGIQGFGPYSVHLNANREDLEVEGFRFSTSEGGK